MAKAKKKHVLPKGFRAINPQGSAWKGNKVGDSLQGKMGAVKSVHFEKQGKQPPRDVNVYTIHTADGDVQVWESAGLRALADVKKGREVYIVFTGLKQIKKGQQPMRDYEVATK